jgi:hypothetical protein
MKSVVVRERSGFGAGNILSQRWLVWFGLLLVVSSVDHFFFVFTKKKQKGN